MKLNLTALKQMNIKRDNALALFLQGLPLFEDISLIVLDTLLSQSSAEDYNSGDIIISEGDESDGKAYIIVSGTVDVFIAGEKISTLGEGSIFGEYALICNEKRSATIQVASALKCIVLTELDIVYLSDETNKLNDILTKRITENIEANRGIFKE